MGGRGYTHPATPKTGGKPRKTISVSSLKLYSTGVGVSRLEHFGVWSVLEQLSLEQFGLEQRPGGLVWSILEWFGLERPRGALARGQIPRQIKEGGSRPPLSLVVDQLFIDKVG
jgi:hypothetical protein